MTEIRYRPGDWRAAVTPQGVALLPATMEADMLGRIWTSLQAGHGLGAVLESLTGAFGTSLRAIPPFAVVTFDAGEVRLAVRGPIEIDVVETDATYGVSGAEVTTWSERVVRNPTSLVVRTDTAVGEGSYGVADGIVLCAELTLAFAPLPTRAPAPGSTPIPTSSPTPTSSHPSTPVHAPTSAHAPTPTATPRNPPEQGDLGADSDGSRGDGEPAPEPAGAPEETIVPPEHTLTDAAAPPSPPTRPIIATPSTTAPPAAGSSGQDSSPDAEDATNRAHSIAEEEVEYTQTELPDDAYDHLWGATVVKSVEHAAVREVDDAEEEEPARAPSSTAKAPPLEPEARDSDGIAPGFAPPPAPAAPDPAHWTAPPLTGLIDSVPGFGGVGAASSSPTWADGSGSDAPVAAGTAATASTPGSATDALPSAAPTTPVALTPAGVSPGTGTIETATSGAGATSADAPGTGAIETGTSGSGTAPAAAVATGGDDHDGLTVTVSELEAMRRLAAADDRGAPASDAGASAGRMILSTGETHPLDRPVIIGRRPRANRVQADQVPLLVTVASPEQDISRNHLEVRIEGRHVLAADLDTTNGSVLHREGTPPLRLTPNEPVLLLSGDVIDLGDGITVLFEDLP
ncbi:FHA domain-containing protein [Herbiconiux sp. P16]|uniref:FHA domain-containing protein n=1 Tax=Herbiconiux wuyangfengii TaxID=3342794 RepID=UPI0035B8E76C